MLEKAYVLYATESYYETVRACVKSIRGVSNIPILVYFINSDVRIDDVENVTSIRWNFEMDDEGGMRRTLENGNFYVDRENTSVFKLFFQRPFVILDALKRASTVAYVDGDSVASPFIDRIFELYNEDSPHPYFTEGIHDWLMAGEYRNDIPVKIRGGADSMDDLSTTLEHPSCVLLGVDQRVRRRYRTTNLFVTGQKAIDFVKEWAEVCQHPTILSNPRWYAPFHEETLANVLLWKYKYLDGPGYIYMNGSIEEATYLAEHRPFKKHVYDLGNWTRVPVSKQDLLVMHGEKRPEVMNEIAEKLKELANIRVLFLAPHLSTGGMPAFLLKRIRALLQFSNLQIVVVEYANHSDEYVVQKNEIRKLVKDFYTLGENKMELIDIIHRHGIDVVHVDEMVEDGHNNWSEGVRKALYAKNRSWRVVETCHNIIFNPDTEKRYHPDSYIFCTPYHLKTFANMPSRKEVIEFPIKKKMHFDPIDLGPGKHVINVGLWTPGKNQGEAVELAKQMPDVQFHFVGNQAGNFRYYWEPLMKDLPPNVHVWGERDDVDRFMAAADVFLFNSTFECNPLVIREAIGYGLPILARNLPQYGDMFDGYITDIDPKRMKEQLYELLERKHEYLIPEDQTEDFCNRHLQIYREIVSANPQEQVENITIDHHFMHEPFLEIKGNSKSLFTVRYYDEDGRCRYENVIKCNHWIRIKKMWYTKWTIKIWKDEELYYEYTLNYENHRVYIAFDSKSLGDTIAWMPYVLEFKKKHKCDVVVSTFKNFLFKDVYPELEFVEPGSIVDNIVGMYTLGWFYDANREPELCNTIPLQKAASNILGLDYQELKPRIAFTPCNKLYDKYVTIATNSTAGCKFWTKEGWQEVINFLHEKGYKVINVSKERNPFDNCEQIEDVSMENTMNIIHHSHLFIGLSSGLSWLAWAMNKKVVMISNFTEADHEFQCIRIDRKDVCHGCWNKAEHRFDPGDWNWCPEHKGTDRQFECHQKIDANQVVIALLGHI